MKSTITIYRRDFQAVGGGNHDNGLFDDVLYQLGSAIDPDDYNDIDSVTITYDTNDPIGIEKE